MINNRSAEIIAHRGASQDALENTLEAFQLGLDQGADAIECDVHVSKDGELIVIHDPDLRRIFGIEGIVKEMTLADLKALDTRIPSLGEVLDIVPDGRRIFIEIKCGLGAIAPLENLLAVSDIPFSQIVLMEFDLDTVIVLNKILPEAEVLWLNDFPALCFPWRRRKMCNEIIRTACQHGLDGVNLQNIPQLDGRFIDACHSQNLTCYCWTVDDVARAAKLIKYGIDGIATNRPGWMRDQLKLP